MTAAISASTSASAVMRSRSSASITTMSPGPTRRSSRSMSRSTRAVPVMPGRGLAVRDSSADIFMGRFCRGTLRLRWRRAVTPASEVMFCHTRHRLGDLCAVILRRVEQLARVGPATVRIAQPGEHPRELGYPIVVVQLSHAAGLVGARAVDDKMDVGVCGDLWQVGDHDDLAGARQPRQPPSDLYGGPAADAGV